MSTTVCKPCLCRNARVKQTDKISLASELWHMCRCVFICFSQIFASAEIFRLESKVSIEPEEERTPQSHPEVKQFNNLWSNENDKSHTDVLIEIVISKMSVEGISL